MQVGSIVKIISTGSRYDGYDSFFQHYGLTEYLPQYCAARATNKACLPEDLVKVLEIREHIRKGIPLYVMRNLRSGAIILFDDETIEEVAPPEEFELETVLGDMPLAALFAR